MTTLFNYFKQFFHPKENKDRKRRRVENLTEGPPQFPKYRRVSNVFPVRYGQRLEEDEIDHFQLTQQSQKGYNDILENFLMSQQRKQFEKINEDEFSDDEETSSTRVPIATHRYDNAQKPSTSGYNFSTSRQSPTSTSSFNFTQNKFNKNEDVQFGTQKSRRAIPELVPIPSSTQSNGLSNGTVSGTRRRSFYDFARKNRAFNDSPAPKASVSVIDRCHNLKVHNEYNNLLKKLIPRCTQKATVKQSNNFMKPREELIETVDLSQEETKFANSASAAGNYTSSRHVNPPLYQQNKSAFKKPLEFVEVSDDEDTEPSFAGHIISSTMVKPKNERSNSVSQNKSSLHFTVPEVPAVNSLRDRQQSRNCLKENAISAIVKKYNESRSKNESKIREATMTVSQRSNDTAIHEKLQQRKLDDTLTSLMKCIVLDEEDEKIDEFPDLTDEMLRIVRYGLHGPRNEVMISKFNMSITRHDLNTLDALNWLNDEIINFYMELLRQRCEEVEHLPKVHAMNTFFIPKLLSSGHAGVRRWTRKVDIFSYDIIPVPVHVGGVHWCMSVINIRDKTIRYYDSMGHPNTTVVEALKNYLQDESMDKRKTKLDTTDWTVECIRDCPQQRNGSDCGVFSCMVAEFLTRDSKPSFDQQHMQYFRRKMVFEIVTGKLLLGY